MKEAGATQAVPSVQDAASCSPRGLAPASLHQKVTGLPGLPVPLLLKARPLSPHPVARDRCVAVTGDRSPVGCVLSEIRKTPGG